MKVIAKLFIFIIIVCSCNEERKYVKVIDRLNNTDFSSIKNMAIHYRSKGKSKNSSIYAVNEYGSSCSPYFVEINNESNEIINVTRGSMTENCAEFEEEKLRLSILEFLKYKVILVQVDNESNVYINPFAQEKANIIRKESISDETLKVRGFKNLKNKWYIKS